MGGAALVPGNVTAVAEANIATDPEAAQIVLNAPWDITLVPLDITMEHLLTEDDRDRLRRSANPLAGILDQMLDHYFNFYVGVYGHRSCALHDPLAAALAIGDIQAGRAPAVPVIVDTTGGPGRGQTICDLRSQRHRSQPDHSHDTAGVTARIVFQTDRDLAPLLVERLNVTSA